MLFFPVGAAKPTRIQGCFVSDKEVEKVVAFIKGSQTAEYDDQILEEIERQAEAAGKSAGGGSGGGGFDAQNEMLPAAIECVVETGQAHPPRFCSVSSNWDMPERHGSSMRWNPAGLSVHLREANRARY